MRKPGFLPKHYGKPQAATQAVEVATIESLRTIPFAGRMLTPDEAQKAHQYQVSHIEYLEVKAEVESRIAKIREQDMPRIKLDIPKWRRAIDMRESVTMPSHYQYAEAVKEITLDGQVFTAERRRTDTILGLEWGMHDRDSGEKDVDASRLLESQWFYDAVQAFVEAWYRGHILVELGKWDSFLLEFDKVTVFDIENLEPHKGMLIPDALNINTGVQYRGNKQLEKCLIEVFGDKKIGIYGIAGQYTIYKKLAVAYWSKFGELAAVPLRWAKTDGGKEHQAKLFKDMMDAAFASVLVTDIADEINFAPTNVTQAQQVFGQLIKFCDETIAKLFVGSPAVLEKPTEGGFSANIIHDDNFRALIQANAHRIAMIINRQLLPKAQALGMPIDAKRLEFRWNFKGQMAPEKQIVIDQGLHNMGWQHEEEEIRERYGTKGHFKLEVVDKGTPPALPDPSKPTPPGTKQAQEAEKRKAELQAQFADFVASLSPEQLEQFMAAVNPESPPFDGGCC